eukprot:1630774-Rhodomonas_salina.2
MPRAVLYCRPPPSRSPSLRTHARLHHSHSYVTAPQSNGRHSRRRSSRRTTPEQSSHAAHRA